MRDRHEDFHQTGATITAIGMGTVPMAAHFATEFAMPFSLLVDNDRLSYKALELKRGTLWDIAGPHMWLDFTKRLLKGQALAKVQADPMQLAGVAIVEPGGAIRYVHRSNDPADNPPLDELLGRLR